MLSTAKWMPGIYFQIGNEEFNFRDCSMKYKNYNIGCVA